MTDATKLTRRITGVGLIGFWLVLFYLWPLLPVVDAILVSVLVAALPVLSLAQVPLIGRARIERLPAYWSSIVTLWLVGTACWFVGTRSEGGAQLGLVPLPLVELAGWSLGLTAAAMFIIGAFRWIAAVLQVPDGQLLRELLPQTGHERRIFGLLSVAAGTGEEFAYRGYIIPVLAPLMGTAGAAVLSTVVFGVLHSYQGVLGIVRTGLMGGILAVGFLASGSLWPSIIAHTTVDLLAGLVLGDRLLSHPTVPGVEGKAAPTPFEG